MKINRLLFFIIIILHVVFVIISMNQPFIGDEILYPEGAKAVLKTKGIPIFDYGINGKNFEQSVHVPLYIYLLSGSIFLFGYNVYSIRAISGVFNFFVIVLVYLIIKEILKDNRDKECYAVLGTAFYALNPIVIQNSVLVDIDGGLLNFSMYLFLYLFIKKVKFQYLIPSLILVFLSKEIGPIMLFGTLLIFYFLTFDFKKIPGFLWLFLFSGAISLIILKISSVIFGFNMFMIFEHNFGKKPPITLLSLIRNFWEFKVFFYFAVPFFVLLFLVLSLIFYYRVLKNRKFLKETKDMFIFNLIGMLTILVYIYLGGSAWGFPKYQITGVAGMSIFIALMLSENDFISKLNSLLKNYIVVIIALIFIMTIYLSYFVGDPLIPEIDATPENVEIREAFFLVLKSFSLYVILPFIICFFVFSFLRVKNKFFLVLIFLCFFMFFYLDILHVIVDYSTYSKYGDEGVLEIVEYVKEKNIPISEIATHAHIGSYLNMSEYFEITFVYNDPEEFRREIVNNKKIEYLIIWKRDIKRIGDNLDYFLLKEKIGSYYIYKKK